MVGTLRAKLRRDLSRQKAQFAAVAATLFLGIALFGASYDAFQNLKASYAETYERLRFADLTVTGGPTEELLARGRALGVEAEEVRTVRDLPLAIEGHKVLGRVVGLPASGQPAVNRVQVQSGTYLSPAASDGVLVERHTASHFDLEPGDELEVLGADGWRRMVVLGSVASPEYIWPALSRQEILVPADEFAVVFVPEPMARTLAGPSVPRQVLFSYGPGVDGRAVTAELTRLASREGAADVFTLGEQPSNAALQEDVRGFNELSLLFPVLFLASAAMATYVLLTRLVHAQARQIGTLTALGLGRRSLFAHYLGYGVVAGLAGAVPGALAGMALAGAISHVYASAVGIPMTVVVVRWTTPIIGIALGTMAGMVAAGAPALAASRVEPAEAMGGFRAVRTARHARAPLAVLARRVPPRWVMVLRGIGRNRRRAAYTVVGVVFALTLVLVSWGMLDTTQVLLGRQFHRIQRQDAQVFFTTRAGARAISALEEVPGVAQVEPAADLPVSLGLGERRYRTSVLALPRDTAMHEFLLEDGSAAPLPSSGILAGAGLRETLGVGPGDRLELTLLELDASITVSIAGFVEEPLGTYAYVSLPALQGSLGGTPVPEIVNSAMVRYTAGADRDAVRDRIAALPDVGAVVDSRALERQVGSFMGLFYAFVGVMLAFGAVMAFALIFATMSVNLAERSVEMAMLRAEGVGRGTVARLITAENLVLTAIGVAPGLLIGYLVAREFMSSFSSDLFTFSLAIRPTTLLFSALALLAVALVTQWPGLRAVDRLDIPTVVRERSG